MPQPADQAKPQPSIPAPSFDAVHGRGPLTDLAGQILALSKMNWNNDALYDSLPCTIRYAQTLKHMPGLLPMPYDYRLFM